VVAELVEVHGERREHAVLRIAQLGLRVRCRGDEQRRRRQGTKDRGCRASRHTIGADPPGEVTWELDAATIDRLRKELGSQSRSLRRARVSSR